MASAGEDVVLSIEETNRLRASLGLKPLNLEAPQQRAAEQRKPPPEAPKPDAEAIRAKLAETREKRRREQELHATRGLGEAGGDADDVGTWVTKMRATPQQQPPAKRQAREGDRDGRGRQPRGGGGGGSGEEGGDGDEDGTEGAAELAGARVRHGADELAEGETMVLTLADAPILGAGGGLNDAADELEEVARAQDNARARARRAAGAEAKPLWAEDGKVRSLLDKYDEEEEEAGFTLDEAGRAAAAAARQDEVRQRLAAAAAALDAAVPPPMGGTADYMTADEAAAAASAAGGGLKKKKKKRKLRTTRAEADDDEGGGAAAADDGGGGLDLDALEAAARAEGGDDLGSRDARQRRREAAEAAAAAQAAERTARFQRAVEKTNWASEALKLPAGGLGGDEDEAEAELAESLSRARRLTQRAGGSGGGAGAASGVAPESVEEIAARLAQKRAEDEELLREQLATGVAPDLFNATTEFVRNIGGGGEDGEDGEDEGGEPQRPEAPYMDVDMDDAPGARPDAEQQQNGGGDAAGGETSTGAAAAAATPAPAKQRNFRKRGGWVSAEDGGGAGPDGDGQQEEQQRGRGAEAAGVASVAGDRVIGRGLAGALGLLQETGALKARTEWAGRTNEKKPVALVGLEDVYTGGAQEDRLSRSIEAALTQRDEFGRVMTPKERFRTLCHQFHGIFPSKNKEAHRQRKYLEDVAVKKATSSADASADLDRMRALTASLGTPYLPLDGKAPLPGLAGGDDDDAPLPVARGGGGGGGGKLQLGGGLTPLTGDRKVEAMLGIKKPPPGGKGGGGAMPPPKPKGR